MKAILALLAIGFESSSSKTPEFISFARKFKNAITKELAIAGCKLTAYSVGHFYVSGFFRNEKNECYYFSLSDVRDSKYEMNRGGVQLLWRMAKNEKDYTGGKNRYNWIDEGMGKTISDQIYMDMNKVSFLSGRNK